MTRSFGNFALNIPILLFQMSRIPIIFLQTSPFPISPNGASKWFDFDVRVGLIEVSASKHGKNKSGVRLIQVLLYYVILASPTVIKMLITYLLTYVAQSPTALKVLHTFSRSPWSVNRLSNTNLSFYQSFFLRTMATPIISFTDFSL